MSNTPPKPTSSNIGAILAELAARGRQWLQDNAPAWEAAMKADAGGSSPAPPEEEEADREASGDLRSD